MFEDFATKLMIQVQNDGTQLRVLYSEPEKDPIKGTMVLIPGYISLVSAWEELLEHMRKDYRLYVIETREKHTAVLAKNAKMDIDTVANDLKRVIEYLMLDDYFIVASSMGAAFTLYSVSKGLINPKMIFLVGPLLALPLPKIGWPFVYIANNFLWKLFIKPLTKLVVRLVYLNPDQKEQIRKYFSYLDNLKVPRVRKSLIALKKLQIKEEDLQKISVFCMCIGAERDKAHQSRLTSWIAEKLPNAEYRDLYTNIAAHGMPLLEVIKEKIER
ncbi:MAG: alpha/beta fold hydrolase [Candidatus Heimdallarchaeaceae archaeon]